MESRSKFFLKGNPKLFSFFIPKIQNTLNNFHLKLSNWSREKEYKQFQAALNDINAIFLNRYQFKYGYVRPSAISDINQEVLKRLIDKKDSEIEELKQKITVQGVIYLVICQTCIKTLNSFYHSTTERQNAYSETLLDLLQFSLGGLTREKLKDLLHRTKFNTNRREP